MGWVDLQAKNVEERLEYYSQFTHMKGFRHVLQGEPQRDYMLRPNFMRGVNLLNKFGYTYDVLIFPDQLQFTYDFVKAFPQQPFVIDHIAKPYIKDGKIDEWKKDMRHLGECPNVFCKISGMVTEASWNAWNKPDFTPYLDVIIESFGTDRIMFGSDWPVCLVAATYGDMLTIATDYFAAFTEEEKDKIFGENASIFYHLNQ